MQTYDKLCKNFDLELLIENKQRGKLILRTQELELVDPEWNTCSSLFSGHDPRPCHLTSLNFHLLSAKMWLFLPDKIIIRVRERDLKPQLTAAASIPQECFIIPPWSR